MIVAGIAVMLGAAAALRWRPFRARVEGESMSPTLEPGDWLVAVASPRLAAGSLVVLEHPERRRLELIKRLEALPGDPVGRRALRPGEYWVSGDNPRASTDSRAFGPVDVSHIRGVVLARYWPLRRARLLLPGSSGAVPGRSPLPPERQLERRGRVAQSLEGPGQEADEVGTGLA